MLNFEVIFNNGKKEQVDTLGILRRTFGQTQKQVAEKIRRSVSCVGHMDRYSPEYDQVIDIAEYAKANGFRTNVQFIQQGCPEDLEKEVTAMTLEDLIELLSRLIQERCEANSDLDRCDDLYQDIRKLKKEIIKKYGEKVYYRG